MKIQIKVEGISSQLEKIRLGLGAEKVPFEPVNDMVVSDIRPFFDSVSGLLVKDNRVVFVYIPDHDSMPFFRASQPRDLRKVHFAYCDTLQSMEEAGKKERFHVKTRDDDRYLIDRKGRKLLVGLYPCQNCLNKVKYHGFTKRMGETQRKEIITSFTAKEALAFLQNRFDRLQKQATSDLRRDTQPAGYAPNHREVSLAYRKKQGFVCEWVRANGEKCGVDLKHATKCTDVHHKNGRKWDNSEDNLLCVCKLCHAEIHSDSHYYPVSEECRGAIEKARRVQGISP